MITGSIKKNYLKDCSQKYPDVSTKKVGCVADRILGRVDIYGIMTVCQHFANDPGID